MYLNKTLGKILCVLCWECDLLLISDVKEGLYERDISVFIKTDDIARVTLYFL